MLLWSCGRPIEPAAGTGRLLRRVERAKLVIDTGGMVTQAGEPMLVPLFANLELEKLQCCMRTTPYQCTLLVLHQRGLPNGLKGGSVRSRWLSCKYSNVTAISAMLWNPFGKLPESSTSTGRLYGHRLAASWQFTKCMLHAKLTQRYDTPSVCNCKCITHLFVWLSRQMKIFKHAAS